MFFADIQEGADRPLYVDAGNLNAELASMLAECIVERSGLAAALREVPESRDWGLGARRPARRRRAFLTIMMDRWKDGC